MHSSVSGVTDHLARDDAHALAIARGIVGDLGSAGSGGVVPVRLFLLPYWVLIFLLKVNQSDYLDIWLILWKLCLVAVDNGRTCSLRRSPKIHFTLRTNYTVSWARISSKGSICATSLHVSWMGVGSESSRRSTGRRWLL